ncbi:MAG TPA: glycoside hydrolase family 2 TIM barrel-domain containing protein [Candidatus Acidoferrales bacterium]|nr:glycoside hydrolase family 2 TIM barrel-domain containing protein [Candidatus Acidoferrales bacterium]
MIGPGAYAALLASALGALLGVAAVRADDAPRRREPLNEGWRYAPGPIEGAESPVLDDGDWAHVTLPHTWNANDAFDRSSGYRRGVGWYRRRLTVDSLAGRRFVLEFEGAGQTAKVFVNGVRAGEHVGGYTGFAFDVTAQLHRGADNVIAVSVDNAADPDVPPLEADFNFYGGLYRNVWLVETGEVRFAPGGVDVETPEVGRDSARVRCSCRVRNDGASPARVELLVRVLAPGGAEVGRRSVSGEIAAGRAAALQPDDIDVRDAQRWSPASPSLYELRAELRVDGRPVDETSERFGIRTIAIDPGRGFLLNGEPLRLDGTNRHQDREGLGNALPDTLQRADIDRIRDDGFNFVRLAHYPQAPAVLDECDRRGLVVWMEIPLVNRIGLSQEFERNARDMLREMIEQNRNHPCIAFWGIANEILLRPPQPEPPGYRERVRELLARLNADAHAQDRSRPTAMALSYDEVDDTSGVHDVTDVLGMNLYFGWYYRALTDLGPWLDIYHAKHPRRPLVVTEYGANGDVRIAAREPRVNDMSADYERRFHEATWPQLAGRRWLLGTAIWNQFDFGSKGRDDSRPNLNTKGLYAFDRTPKDVAFFYRAQLAREPVLHVATRDAPRLAGSRPGDERRTVTVYSNLPSAELVLNGRSLGARTFADRIARWDVRLRAGANELVARGRTGGHELTDRVSLSYEDRAAAIAADTAFALAGNASACQYADAEGTLWEPLRRFVGGSWGVQGGRLSTTRHRIIGTPDDALVQTTLEGVSSCRFDVPPGEYELDVRCVETLHDRAGERVFDVEANGASLATGLDLARQFGRWSEVRLRTSLRVSGRAGVTVAFRARAGETTMSAIALRRRVALR